MCVYVCQSLQIRRAERGRWTINCSPVSHRHGPDGTTFTKTGDELPVTLCIQRVNVVIQNLEHYRRMRKSGIRTLLSC